MSFLLYLFIITGIGFKMKPVVVSEQCKILLQKIVDPVAELTVCKIAARKHSLQQQKRWTFICLRHRASDSNNLVNQY